MGRIYIRDIQKFAYLEEGAHMISWFFVFCFLILRSIFLGNVEIFCFILFIYFLYSPRGFFSYLKPCVWVCRMPSSKKNKFVDPITKEIKSRWRCIQKHLSTSPLTTPEQFQAAVLSYNPRYKDEWCFEGLFDYCQHEVR